MSDTFRAEFTVHDGEPPCHRCRALCCRGFATIPLRPDNAEDAALVAAGFAEWRGGLWALPRVDNRCAYLDDATNLCLIHADRPRACREYDCRDLASARTLLSLLARDGDDAIGTPPWEIAQGAVRQGVGPQKARKGREAN